MKFLGLTTGATHAAGGKISNGQAALIMIGAVVAITVFILPGPSILSAGNDAYWSPLLATVPSIVQMSIYVWLGRRYDWQSPFVYLPQLLGRWLGGLVSLSYVWLFVFVGASVDQEIAKVLGAVFMPLTPQPVFIAISMLAAAYVAWLGLEAFGRTAQVMLPLLILVLVLIPIGLIPRLDLANILPILHRGLLPPLRGMAVPMAMRSEAALLLAFLLPHLRTPNRALRTGVLATCAIGLLLVLNVISIISLTGPSEAARLSLPTLAAARMVRITRGIEHIEFLVIGPWTVALLLKVALFILFAAQGVAQVFRLRWRPLTLPLAILTGAVGGWMYPNVPTLAYAITDIWPGYALTMNLLLPLILALIALLRGQPSKESPAGGGRS